MSRGGASRDRYAAHTLLAEATAAATHLGGQTGFGPTAVRLYQVSTARVLGDTGAAIDAARQIDPAAIPSAERRARYFADIARAFHHWGKPEHCYRALLAAEQAAPDEVRYRLAPASPPPVIPARSWSMTGANRGSLRPHIHDLDGVPDVVFSYPNGLLRRHRALWAAHGSSVARKPSA